MGLLLTYMIFNLIIFIQYETSPHTCTLTICLHLMPLKENFLKHCSYLRSWAKILKLPALSLLFHVVFTL